MRAWDSLEKQLWIGYAICVGLLAYISLDAIVSVLSGGSSGFAVIWNFIFTGVPLGLGISALNAARRSSRWAFLGLTVVFLAFHCWLTYLLLRHMQFHELTSKLICLALWRAVFITDAALWLLLLLNDQRRLAGHSFTKDVKELYRSIFPRW